MGREDKYRKTQSRRYEKNERGLGERVDDGRGLGLRESEGDEGK